jgi:hypothetical protein
MTFLVITQGVLRELGRLNHEVIFSTQQSSFPSTEVRMSLKNRTLRGSNSSFRYPNLFQAIEQKGSDCLKPNEHSIDKETRPRSMRRPRDQNLMKELEDDRHLGNWIIPLRFLDS